MTTDFAFLLAADAQSAAHQTERALAVLLGMAVLIAIPIAFLLSLVFAIRTKHAGWIVATVLTGVLLLGLGIFISAGFVQGFKKAVAILGEAAATPGIITSSDGLVSIDAPNGWRQLDNLHDVAALQAGNAFREEYLIVLTDSKEDFTGTLEEHAATTLGDIVENLSNPEVTEPISLTVNGMPALQREIRGAVDNLNVDYLHTTVEGARGFHQVLGWTLRSSRDTAFPVLRQTVATFRENTTETSGPTRDSQPIRQGNAPPAS